MGYENNDKKPESVYSKKIKAGKRRTYFFDVRATRGQDFFLTITESRKRFNEDSYERHKIFLYKEDFNKFVKGLSEAVEYVKTELMPDYDFDSFSHDYPEGDAELVTTENAGNGYSAAVAFESLEQAQVEVKTAPQVVASNSSSEEVDKW